MCELISLKVCVYFYGNSSIRKTAAALSACQVSAGGRWAREHVLLALEESHVVT